MASIDSSRLVSTFTVSVTPSSVPGAGASTSGDRVPVPCAGRALLVGASPAPTDSPGSPAGLALTGRPGRVLWECLAASGATREKYSPDRFLAVFRTVNLFLDYPGEWDRAAARDRAVDTRLAEVTVLLGRDVATAFGLGRLAYFRQADVGGSTVTLLPHPSGLNRLYNDETIRSRVGDSLREAIRMAMLK